MKKIILSVIFSLLCCASFAQKVKFTNNTNTWSMVDSTNACCIPYPTRYTTAYYDSRVVYNGITYQHLNYDFGSCLVREENNRVYVIGTTDSTERVLYDFNLGLNDTLRLVYPEGIYNSWVAQLDSTQLHGSWFKVWHFYGTITTPDSTRSYFYNVIEGIGCTNGVYYPASPYSLYTYSDQLLCFKNDQGFTAPLSVPVSTFGYGYSSSFDNAISCGLFIAPIPATLGTQQLSQKATACSVIPNPINDNSKIVLPYSIQSGKLVIVNELGQMMMNASFQNKEELPIGDNMLAPGIYLYRVTDAQNAKVFQGRFINN